MGDQALARHLVQRMMCKVGLTHQDHDRTHAREAYPHAAPGNDMLRSWSKAAPMEVKSQRRATAASLCAGNQKLHQSQEIIALAPSLK